MLNALSETYSNVTEAVKKVGISRKTHYQWVTESDEYKKAVDDINESLLDRAETILMKRLEKSDTALIFFLKTKGKKRGYVERQETEHSGNITNNMEITFK